MPPTVFQTSVFMANEPGQLARITGLLTEAGVNLRAFTITESGDFGIIRLIADRPADAHDFLKEQGLTVSQTQVLAVHIPDSPGALDRVAKALSHGNVNISYAYVGTAGEGLALLVLKLDQLDRGVEVLENQGMRVLGAGDLE